MSTEIEQMKQAELIVCILNAPHASPRDGKYLWRVEDFLPDQLKNKNTTKHTVAEYMAAWDQFISGFNSR
jgi:hypothetical protein